MPLIKPFRRSSEVPHILTISQLLIDCRYVEQNNTHLLVIAVKPKEVRIITPMHNMSGGERVELVCQSSGSRPPARIHWRKGSVPIEHSGESTSDDGSVTTNFLAFVPSVEDNGKRLSCSATNTQFPEFQLEDSWTLNVLCMKAIKLLLIIHIIAFHMILCALRNQLLIQVWLIFALFSMLIRCSSPISNTGCKHTAQRNP